MDDAGNSYVYRPLTDYGAIRLIELQPPSEDSAARLRCGLLHTTLRELDDEVIYHYCALSYVWGTSTDTTTIEIDGKELSVTVSLAIALGHLRDPRISRYIWADAICIDQKNDEEKSIQVSQMGEVYKTALHTIIWLGEATPQGDRALSFIRDAKDTQAWERLRRANDSNMSDVSDMWEESNRSEGSRMSEEDDGLDMESLGALIELSWFTRVWIYQELIFSRDPWLQCSRLRVRWEDLSTVISSLGSPEKLSEPYQRFLAMDKARKEFRAQIQGQKTRSRVLLDTLIARRGLGVHDHRDMVFAHLGIVVNSPLDGTFEEWDLLKADYHKDPSTLFCDVAQYLSSKIDIFELLSHVEGESDQRYPNTPSWTPNWMVKPLPYRRLKDSVTTLRRQYEEYYGRLEDRVTDTNGFLVLRILPGSYKLWLSSSIISFLGFRMGTVTRISEILTQHDNLLNIETFHANSQNGEDIYADVYRKMYHSWWTTFSQLVDDEAEFGMMLRMAIDKLRALSSLELAPFMNDLFVHVMLHETKPGNTSYPHFLYGRRLAMVSECGLAVVPRSAQIGDVASFFMEKTTVPFLLRPIPAINDHTVHSKIRNTFKLRNPSQKLEVNHYEFVGECILQDYIFSSFDSRYFTDLSGESYPGTLESFVVH